MNPNHTTASYALAASAFVLSALVLLQASRLIEQPANAEMVVNKDNITMITARVETDRELLYVLDSRATRLFAYMHNPNQKRVDLLAVMDVSRAFAVGFGAPAGRGDEPDRRRNR